MIDNFIDHEYEPCNLIYSSDQAKNINLYLGDVSSALNLEFIHKSNIKTVVTAAASMDQVSYKPQDKINHVVYSVLDHKNQNLIKFFDRFYDLVEKQFRNGSILVHCAAGISRSSTLVISYLMKKQSWSFKQAIKYVRKSRPMVLPNLGFERQLKQYEKIILQQQQRRLKSKTSQSNKHSQNNGQLLPDIGTLGQTTTQKKILQAFRIYRKQQDSEKFNRKNIMFNIQNSRNQNKLNILKFQQIQKFKPVSRQFGQTKSASLQTGAERSFKNYQQIGKMTPYMQSRTDQSQVSTSSRHLASRNGLFDSAIIPIKYSTTNKGAQRLKKTNIQFTNLNTNNITINRINIFKQKYVNNNNNPLLSLAQGGLNANNDNNQRIQYQNNILELKTKQHFAKKLSKVRQAQNDISSLAIMIGKKQIAPLKKQVPSLKRIDHEVRNEQQRNRKVAIKNFSFLNND